MTKRGRPSTISQEIESEALALLQNGEQRKNVVKFLKKESGISSRGARFAVQRLVQKLDPETEGALSQESKVDQEIKFTEDYSYNSHTKDYIFYTDRLLGFKIRLKEHKVKSLLQLYSNFNGKGDTINEICSSFALSRPTAVFILKALGKTHDSLPVTNEELINEETEVIVESLLAERNYALHREYEKQAWKQDVDDAKKWRQFEAGEINPYQEFVENFTYRHKPFKIKPEPFPAPLSYSFMAGCSDIHFGASAHASELYRGEDWSTEIAVKTYKSYVDELSKILSNKKNLPDSYYLLVLGDLSHSIKDTTYKGTNLENVEVNTEAQIEAGYLALDYHVQSALALGIEDVRVKVTRGNHNPLGDWAIARFLQLAYEKDERVDIEIAGGRWLSFRHDNNLFLLEHGASAYYKSTVPKGGSGRDSYIQSLFLARPEILQGAKQRYFITADRHNLEYSDAPGFEFIRFGSAVKGDKYADENNLNSRPKQNVLEVNDKGVVGIFNVHLD